MRLSNMFEREKRTVCHAITAKMKTLPTDIHRVFLLHMFETEIRYVYV
jgi:hypothetical protein